MRAVAERDPSSIEGSWQVMLDLESGLRPTFLAGFVDVLHLNQSAEVNAKIFAETYNERLEAANGGRFEFQVMHAGPRGF